MRPRRSAIFAFVIVVAVLRPKPAAAQLNGSHTPGDYGVQSGSQPQPGMYAALFYLRYDADTVKDADGNIVRPSPSSPGSLAVSAVAPLAWYVSKAKFLGANYGAMVVLPFANASIEAPAFALGETIGTSVSDLLLRPLDLGWHTARADVAAGLQLYAPTGQVRARRQREHRQGYVDVRAVRGDDRVSRPETNPQPRRHGLLGAPRQQEGHRRQGRPDPDAPRRSR